MKPTLTALLVVHTLILGCSSPGSLFTSHDPVGRLQVALDEVLADSAFVATIPSIIVGSVTTGEVLYERNSRLLIRPASNMKLVSSAAALHYLGTNFAFSTVVFADSVTADGVVAGDLVIKGYGNPDLTTADLDSLVHLLRLMNIFEVGGDVVVDVSYFDDEFWGRGWMWDDDPSSDQAYMAALPVNDNCVKVVVIPGLIHGDPVIAITDPPTSYVTLTSEAVTVEDSVLVRLEVKRLYERERSNDILISGEVRAGRPPVNREVTVWEPELYAGTLFKERLERDSIRVKGSVRTGLVSEADFELARHDWPLDSVLVNLNKTSDNLSAECVLKTLAAELTGDAGSAAVGISKVYEFLSSLGIDTTAILMVDGSGLSHYNLLTTRMLYTLLQAMAKRPDIFPAYYESLPIAGKDGTLERRMRATSAEGTLRAKTGTISAVSSLSGYVTTTGGELLAFSMSMQSFVGSSTRYKRIEDRIGSIIANFSRTHPVTVAP